mmetsp:Transcript_62929/g.147671  ORF Transcript_62929/g.147671 Transcript_62929/m.147671 type:complete len:231 (-) Transcript_62929:194-886(-)
MNESFRRVGEKEARRKRVARLWVMDRCHEWDSTIQRHGDIQGIFENVQIEEPIWLSQTILAQTKSCRMLSQAENVNSILKFHINSDSGRTAWLGISMSAKTLLKEVVGVHISGVHDASMRRRPFVPVSLEIQEPARVEFLNNFVTNNEIDLERAVPQQHLAASMAGAFHFSETSAVLQGNLVRLQVLFFSDHIPSRKLKTRVERVLLIDERANNAAAAVRITLEEAQFKL